MKLISWNVNGLRACVKKGFFDFFTEQNADAFCLQETKLQPEQAPAEGWDGYYQYWNSAEKKGYSGTALFSKKKPLSVNYGINMEQHDHEGRVITAEYEQFYLVTCYTPNSQGELARLPYRMEWEDDFRSYLLNLGKETASNGCADHNKSQIECGQRKPVIVCGDLNVAAEEIDLKNPDRNHHNAGFSDEERAKFRELLESGFTDTFRKLYPNLEGAYTWWSYRFKARQTNAGWRIDYFLISSWAEELVNDVIIHSEVTGSDHCPIELDINL